MKRAILLFTGLILISFATEAQLNSEKLTEIKLKIKVVNMLPVGWGEICKGTIEEVIEGNKKEIHDTITFGIDASKKFEFLKKDDIRIIAFKNSHEINKESNLPPINGMIDKQKYIWLITEIQNVK